ncbi:MAG: sigma-70 family RNA polymerase sigma factor [Myxococcales bacterium]|nr:sigma-70 family RNA polymerase sigma factor [Myxococcales bacterium]
MLAQSIEPGPARKSEARGAPGARPRRDGLDGGGGGGPGRLGWFNEVAAAHLPALRVRAAQMCRSQGDPEDLVQDALLRAFVARDQMRDPQKARGWLLTIVTNTFLDSVRRRRARPGEVALEVEPPAPVVEDHEAWSELGLEDIRAAVDELPDDVQETYRRFALEGKDYAVISAELGIPKATVGTRILRARKRLRELLLARLEARHA